MGGESGRVGNRTALWLVLATIALFSLYFAEVLFRGEVYYPGDTARVYLPEHTALQRALTSGRLPWWTTDVGAGYPLLAEGQVGAFYPIYLALHSFLPPVLVLTASVLLHYLIAGIGFYYYGRASHLTPVSSYWGAIVFSCGGFAIAHLSHVSVLSTLAWLPWMFAFSRQLIHEGGTRRQLWWRMARLSLACGMQFLAGHPQVSLVGLMIVVGYAGLAGIRLRRGDVRPHLGAWAGALTVGLLLGAPQILPSMQLSALSQRAGGLQESFFLSGSFHPALLLTYFSPFVLGNPYPKGSVEVMGYVGLLPLAWASVGLWHSRHRDKWFHVLLVLGGLFMALGRWNPLYGYLRHVPVLNLFRVPARYLYWTSFGLAALSAFGLEAARTASDRQDGTVGWLLLGLASLMGVLVLVLVGRATDTNDLALAWRWIPLILLVASLAILWVCRRSAIRAWTGVAFFVLVVDLYAYGAVLDGTYNATMPYREVVRTPESLSFLARDDALYRIYTKEEILPALSVMRESYFPNMAMTQGLSSANLYMPLVPQKYETYLRELTAERLNRLNVKYYLIPQLLPVDEASELYDVHNPLASLPVNVWLNTTQGGPLDLQVVDVAIESYLSHAVDLADGYLTAEFAMRDEAGAEVVIPLRAGLDTAEWAYVRDDVRTRVAHSMPAVATSWPARSGFPPRAHDGHTYVTRQRLPAPLSLAEVMLRPKIPEAFVRVERIRLWDSAGKEYLLTHLLGLGDHTIVYRSEDVLIYRNEDVLPRAYLLQASLVMASGRDLILPRLVPAEQIGEVEMLAYADNEIIMGVESEQAAYLILGDLDYPGWEALVDGSPEAILCADGVYRALAIAPGRHQVVLRYVPWRNYLNGLLPSRIFGPVEWAGRFGRGRVQ